MAPRTPELVTVHPINQDSARARSPSVVSCGTRFIEYTGAQDPAPTPPSSSKFFLSFLLFHGSSFSSFFGSAPRELLLAFPVFASRAFQPSCRSCFPVYWRPGPPSFFFSSYAFSFRSTVLIFTDHFISSSCSRAWWQSSVARPLAAEFSGSPLPPPVPGP